MSNVAKKVYMRNPVSGTEHSLLYQNETNVSSAGEARILKGDHKSQAIVKRYRNASKSFNA